MVFFLYQILFFVVSLSLFFLPGYFLLLAIFGKEKSFSATEKAIFSAALSLASIDFLLILMGKIGIGINRASILIGILAILVFSWLYFRFVSSKNTARKQSEQNGMPIPLSKKQVAIFITLLALSVLIKTASLKNSIFPSATDLAHHAYWIKSIATTQSLPSYEKSDIIKVENGYALGEPQEIDDFIIGEHLFFAAIMIISGHDPISPHISISLFLVNLLGILAVFILTRRLFEDFEWGGSAAILSLLLIGPVFALSSSQANFVSGGVIGNLIGNFLIPVAFYFYLRALKEKNVLFLSLAFIFTFTLAYSHHLSTLIFVSSLGLSVFGIILADPKKSLGDLRNVFAMLSRPKMLLLIALFFAFFFFVLMPGYIQNSAIKTVIGDPNRSTKEGLPLERLVSLVGDARFVLGFLGILILFVFRKTMRYPFAILFGWSVIIFLMSWKPTILNLNIPSIRVANYVVFPLVILSSFFISWIFHEAFKKAPSVLAIKKGWLATLFVIFTAFIFSTGYKNNSNSLKDSPDIRSTLLTFEASKYLAERIEGNDIVIKDHNYISSDAWMKLFFMKDYNFPLTRSFFFRYEDYPNREHCTNHMISKPTSPEGKQCLEQLGVNFLMVNPEIDSSQFQKSRLFWEVYSSDTISIFYRKK